MNYCLMRFNEIVILFLHYYDIQFIITNAIYIGPLKARYLLRQLKVVLNSHFFIKYLRHLILRQKRRFCNLYKKKSMMQYDFDILFVLG